MRRERKLNARQRESKIQLVVRLERAMSVVFYSLRREKSTYNALNRMSDSKLLQKLKRIKCLYKYYYIPPESEDGDEPAEIVEEVTSENRPQFNSASYAYMCEIRNKWAASQEIHKQPFRGY